MSLYMESTKIPAERTAQEIAHLLGQAGASSILTEYRERKVIGIGFRIHIAGNDVPFLLPVRSDSIFLHLQKRRSPANRMKNTDPDRQQADRVAWRQILRWVQAQLALIETGMVRVEEVFLPYCQMGPNETLFDRIEKRGFQALPGPAGK